VRAPTGGSSLLITPLQPQKFFSGLWLGKGEFRVHSVLSWFVPNQQVQYQGRTTALSDTLWMATEEFHLSHAAPTSRTTFISILGPDRLHMTCDDVPGGADILLDESGFHFTPYLFRSPFKGRYLLVRCIDRARLDESGLLHDEIKMYYAGVHLATMSMAITIDRAPRL
jgi:hypothetical protein